MFSLFSDRGATGLLRRRPWLVAELAGAAVAMSGAPRADLVDHDPVSGANTSSSSSSAPDVKPTTAPNAAGDADETTTGGAGPCTFKVKGKLVVRDPDLTDQAQDGTVRHDVIADNTPLQDVEVRVWGRTTSGWYNSWGSDSTASEAAFVVTESRCNARVVKVEARFHNADLDVSGPDSPSWYLLDETPNAVDPNVIDLHREPFRGDDGD